MPRQRKAKTPIPSDELDGRSVRWAPKGSHPSQVSSLFKNDPTFKEFRKILRQQRQEDYRLADKEIDATIRKKEETKRCMSSTPTPSHDQNGHALLSAKVRSTPRQQLFTTSITIEEQLNGGVVLQKRPFLLSAGDCVDKGSYARLPLQP